VSLGKLASGADAEAFRTVMRFVISTIPDAAQTAVRPVDGPGGPTPEERHERPSAETDALANGFPEKYVNLVDPMLLLLREAAAAAKMGDVIAEEAAIQRARELGRTAGLMSRGKISRWLGQAVLARIRAGELRRGVELVGAVTPRLIVFSDRLLFDGTCRVIDSDVRASVEIDGQILQSSRPTLTRMALGSILPGSAIMVGMATAKTEAKDGRKANFMVVHPAWRIVEPIDPDKAADVRGVAAQINAIAESCRREGSAAPVSSRRPSPSVGSSLDDQLQQLERASKLLADGAITEEEFATTKARIFGTH